MTVTTGLIDVHGGRPERSDIAVAAVFLVLGLAEALLGGTDGNRGVYVVAALLASIPLAWRRQYPAPTFVIVSLPFGPMILLPTPTDDLLVALVAMLLAGFSLGLHATRRELAIGVATAGVLIGGSILLDGKGPDDVLYASLIIGLAVGPARLLRHRIAEAARYAERAVRAEHELERSAAAAAAAERNRLAREMHDIVGHGVSLMVVHAAAAESHLTEPEIARHSLQAIQDTGRQAVSDLTRMLGLLRDEHAEIGLAPQPGLGDLERLVGSARSSGDEVSLRVDGDPARVPATVGLTAYRVVQEGLTNARRHAPGAPVEVRVAVSERAVNIQVENRAAQAAARPMQPAGAGTGIAGLRERVELFAGALRAGPQRGGGWALDATVPLHGVAE